MAVAQTVDLTTRTVSGKTDLPQTNLSEELMSFYSVALSKPLDELQADVSAGMFPIVQNELNLKVEQGERESDEKFINFVLQTQPDVESAAEFIRNELAGNVFEGHVAPDIAAILLDSENGSKLERQLIERSIAAQRIIDRRASQYEGSWGEAIGGFADTVVSEGVQNVLGGVTGSDVFESAWQLRDLAQQANQLLFMNLPKEQFEQEFDAIIQRVEDMGFLSERNPFFFHQFIDMIREGGRGATSDTAVGFAGLDVALAPLSIPFATLRGGASSVPKVITQIGGSQKAANVVLTQAASNPNAPIVVANSAPALATPGRVGVDLWAAPELTVMRQMEANNSALDQVKAAAFGSYVDADIIQRNAIDLLKKTQDRLPTYPKQELNYEVRTDEAGNIFGAVILGRRSSGAQTAPVPYATIASAQRMADRIGGEVLPTMHNGVTAYVVRKEVGLPTTGLVDATDLNQIATNIFSGIMSTTARTTVDLDGRIKQAEAQVARVLSELNSRFNKVRRKVSNDESIKLDVFFRELRDDPLHNWRNEAMPVAEFEVRYTQKFGIQPSQEVKDYYLALTEINDVDYYLTADGLLKDAINNGEEMVRVDQNYYRSKPVTLDPSEPVYDPALGRWRVVSDYNNKASFYELHDFPVLSGNSGRVQYIVMDSPVTRRLYHTDVLPYNIGGHRARDGTVNFYLKQDNDVTLGTGRVLEGRPRTFMGVRLQDEAEAAVTQINTVIDALNTAARQGNVQISNYRQAFTGNTNLNALVRANNGWNNNLDTIDDFIQFAEDYGIDLTKRVNYAGDGEPLVGQGFSGINTVGGHFRTSNLARGRGMKPLMGYGGNELESLDPTTSMQRGYLQSVQRYGNNFYLRNAMAGWLKAAKETGAIVESPNVPASNLRQLFKETKVSAKTAAGQALEKERMTINFRLNNTTADVRWYQSAVRGMADYVYGKGSKKGAAILDWAATKDPTQFFRSVAFHTKLGLFALPQLYVQASQMINIIGIVGPKVGMRAGLGVGPMRMALISGIPDVAAQRIAQIQSSFTGLSPEEFLNLRDWIRQSGRNLVDQVAIEENNDFALYKPGIGKAVLDAGLVPFREGELAARIMAALANRLELKASGFAGDIMADSVTRRMIHRQDVLTASMTSASSAPWQRSFLSMPLQFMTYNVRMMEQIFTRNILTPAERLRLALTHMTVYGAAGIPIVGMLADKLSFEHGIQVDTQSYEIARYGTLDAILSLITGEDTAIATRLAAGEGFTDFFRQIFEGETPVTELISGPGGQITADVFGSMRAFGMNIFHPHWDAASYDWHKLGRNLASYEMGYRLWVGAKTGEYISRRTQDVMMTDLSAVDTYLLAAGVPLKQIDYMWNVLEHERRNKKHLESHAQEIKRLQNIAIEYINSGDYAAANNIAKDMGAMMQILQPYEKEVVLRRLSRDMTIFDALIQRSIEHGKPEIAAALQNYMRN